MARSVSVTAATAEVPPDRGRGEVALTASNVGTRPVRGRGLVPAGETRETWLAVGGEPERDFRTDDTQPAATGPIPVGGRSSCHRVSDKTPDQARHQSRPARSRRDHGG